MVTKSDIKAGQAVYSSAMLKMFYNFLILTISNPLAWKCPTKLQLEFFNRNVTNNHLDVGIGSGYYMDHCKFPDPVNAQLTLMDLNQNCLNYCAHKLQRYKPQLLQHDVFQTMSNINSKYTSISLNYVLHCLPGVLNDKEVVISNLKHLLAPDGVMFGSTILGHGSKPNWFAKRLLTLYNKKKIFCNMFDNKNDLRMILSKHFKQVEITQVGLVAMFKVLI